MQFYKETEFKDTEIGWIPKEWNLIKLKDIAKFREAKRIKRTGKVSSIPMELVPDTSIFAEYQRLPMEHVKTSTYCEAGDILLARITPSVENGKQGIVPFDIPNGFALATTEVFPIAPESNKIDRFFLFYLLKFNKFRQKIIASMTGTTGRQRVQKKAVENLMIHIPSFAEQQKIAEILSTVDNSIWKVDDVIERTERLKKGLMQELLTKGIGHEEFKNTEIGRIPSEWEIVRLGEVSKEMYYGVTAKAVDYDSGLKILRTTDINNYTVEWDNLPFCEITEKESKYKKYLIRKGDLIVARAGTVGISVLAERNFDDVIFGSYLIKVKLNDQLAPKFVHYFLQTSFYWQHISRAQGSTLKNINLSLLKSMPLPIPPLQEQQKIAEILSTVDKKLELERKRKEKLARIKKGLMNLLLTGKVRVRVGGS